MTPLRNPIVHTNDPAPSRLAAVDMTASGARGRQCAEVLRMVRRHPGSTAGELAALEGSNLDRVQVARRLTDLSHSGEVIRGGHRQCDVAGRACSVWYPKEAQGALPLTIESAGGN